MKILKKVISIILTTPMIFMCMVGFERCGIKGVSSLLCTIFVYVLFKSGETLEDIC